MSKSIKYRLRGVVPRLDRKPSSLRQDCIPWPQSRNSSDKENARLRYCPVCDTVYTVVRRQLYFNRDTTVEAVPVTWTAGKQ